MCAAVTAAGGSVQGAGTGVARPGQPRWEVVKKMEHQTGLDGPDGTKDGCWASIGRGDASESEPESEPTPQPGPRPATGEPQVDAALKLLDRLPGLPVSEHPELFEQVHAQLSDVLGELDSGPAGPAGG
jgi:hypothetical protein